MKYESPNVRKHTFGHVRPAKIQISLRIRTVWSEPPLNAIWSTTDTKFPHADNEDSNQTMWMRSLIFHYGFCLSHLFEGTSSNIADHNMWLAVSRGFAYIYVDVSMMLHVSYCGYMRNIYVPPTRSKFHNVTVTFHEYAFVHTIFRVSSCYSEVSMMLPTSYCGYVQLYLYAVIHLKMLQCYSNISWL